MENNEDTFVAPKSKYLEKIMERGIPVESAKFHQAIDNGYKVPESFFNKDSLNKSRQAKMWWINGDGLLCFQNNKYFLIPSADVIFVHFE